MAPRPGRGPAGDDPVVAGDGDAPPGAPTAEELATALPEDELQDLVDLVVERVDALR